MKKVIALLVIAILLISTIAPAFAGPDTCPVDGCHGTYRRTKVVKDWHWKKHKDKTDTNALGQPIMFEQEERTIKIYCSKGTHTKTETRGKGRWFVVNWLVGLLGGYDD